VDGPIRAVISADSHVIEPVDEIWGDLLPSGYFDGTTEVFSQRPGGSDPKARTDEMDTDRVSAEVLYPSLAMKLFSLENPELQAAAFRCYNEWLGRYCAASPDRLFGIGLLPTYDVERSLEELRFCCAAGMRGALIWQVPPAHLPFSGSHYDPIWEACADLGMPVSLHINTEFGYLTDVMRQGNTLFSNGELLFRFAINQKLLAMMDALTSLTISGALDRFRKLKVVIVENEASWLPFFVDQLDYYYGRFDGSKGEGAVVIALDRLPSEVFKSQVFVTFFRDPYAGFVAKSFEAGNLMWSSDYPHGNSTWPESQKVIQDRLGELPEALIEETVWSNVVALYGIDGAAVLAAQSRIE